MPVIIVSFNRRPSWNVTIHYWGQCAHAHTHNCTASFFPLWLSRGTRSVDCLTWGALQISGGGGLMATFCPTHVKRTDHAEKERERLAVFRLKEMELFPKRETQKGNMPRGWMNCCKVEKLKDKQDTAFSFFMYMNVYSCTSTKTLSPAAFNRPHNCLHLYLFQHIIMFAQKSTACILNVYSKWGTIYMVVVHCTRLHIIA